MTARVRQVTVGTTATQLDGTETDRSSGYSIEISHESATTVYVGGDDVNTSDKGRKVIANAPLSLDLHSNEHVYGRVASGTVTVTIFETGV